MTIRFLICAAAVLAVWTLLARPAVAAALIYAQGGN